MKKNYKKGFTLAEVLISLTIIGIIIAFYLPVHKTVTNIYTTLAFSAFENLGAITKELKKGRTIKIDSVDTHTTEVSNGRKILNSDDTIFCKQIIEIANTKGPTNCTSFSTVSGSTPLEYKFSSLNYDSPNFITTNGHRYYLSAHQDQNDLVSSKFGYRLIAIDLTGTKAPNSDTADKKPADIVYFIILDNGNIMPTGVAATNRNYINTKVSTYHYSLPEGTVKAKGCTYITDSPQSIKKGDCPFGVDSISYPTEDDKTYSYQTAYCLKYGDNGDFAGYDCTTAGIAQSALCQPGGDADECKITLIKPMYRVKI